MSKIEMVVLTRPQPNRIELRQPSPDPSAPLAGQLLAIAEEHVRGWTVYTGTNTAQALSLDAVLRIVWGA